jgi:uncharacterized phage protein (TIGR01671 family)
MREIKFRGKCEPGYDYSEGDGWIYGSLLTDGKDCGIVKPEDLSFNNGTDDGINGLNDFSFIPVILETVGQFTGLTDKNGKEIYEGDILSFDYEDHVDIDISRYENKPCYIVKYDKDISYHVCGKGIDRSKKLFCHAFRFKHCDIVSNIYDNPELLK